MKKIAGMLRQHSYLCNFNSASCFAASLILTFSLIVLASAAFCDEQLPNLITDRPTKAANTAIVQPGFVLWETGFKFARVDAEESRMDEFYFLDSVFRIGLAEKAELRVGWLSGKWEESTTPESVKDSHGIGDASLGIKMKIIDEKGRLPAMALLLGAILPVGNDEFSAERFDPSATIAFSHALTDDVGLVYNLGVVAISGRNSTGEIETDTFIDYSVAFSHGGNPFFTPFLEAFGEVPFDNSQRSNFSIGGGVTSMVLPNLQFDTSGGAGKSGSVTDWFIGIGLSVRFPR